MSRPARIPVRLAVVAPVAFGAFVEVTSWPQAFVALAACPLAAWWVLGPLVGETVVTELIEEFEQAGLAYYDDFFELSGNWPSWLRLLAMAG